MREQAKDHHEDLSAALDHLIDSGGKRIRPNITLLFGKMLNGDLNSLITLSAAIELLHTATLVHDDLIDGSLLRRGIPTLNSKWSPAATVLTGDFLFAKAAFLAAETDSVPVMKLFSNTLSTIVNGEIVQMFSSRCNPDRNEYYRRIYSKTASLFETSSLAAAIIANCDEITKENIRQYGYELGLAFQIIDDIFDFTSEQDQIGKPVGGDLRQGLITLPAILYFEENSNDPIVKDYFENNCIPTKSNINPLINNIRKSNAIMRSLEIAKQHSEKSISEILRLPDSIYRQALIQMAHFVTEREI
jgi:geranylgeranyl pyrophosphate synthase